MAAHSGEEMHYVMPMPPEPAGVHKIDTGEIGLHANDLPLLLNQTQANPPIS